MAAYSSDSSSPPTNYSTANLPRRDAPPIGRQNLPLLAVAGGPPPFSFFSGGRKSTPTRTAVEYRAASAMAEKSGEHVRDVFMMQGNSSGASSTNSRDNQSSEQDAVGVKPFIVDSGASVHATGDLTVFSNFQYITTNMRLLTANGTMMDITGRGTVRHDNITLHGVLFVAGLDANIVSVSKLLELDYTVEFTRTSCFIRDAGTAELVGQGHLVNGVFELDFLEAPRT